MAARAPALLAILLAGCHAPPAPEPAAPPPPPSTPQRTLDEYERAFAATDAAALAACYDDSPDTTVVHGDGTIWRGIDAIRAGNAAAFAEVAFERASLTLDGAWRSGDVAWSNGRFTATTRRRADGARFELAVVTSFVLRDVDGVWRIVLEQSTPQAGVPRLRPIDGGR